MPTPFLPRQSDPIAGGLTTPNSWFTFFSGLREFIASSGLDVGVIDQILARLDELEEAQQGQFLIQGLLSVKVLGTPEGGIVQVQLENDEASPGKSYAYQVSPEGAKGWHLTTPAEYPDPFAIHLVDENGAFLVDENNNFLAGGRVLNVITQASDFPAPVAGVITLANNQEYRLHGLIDMTGYRIVFGSNNTLTGASSGADGLLFPDTLGAARMTGSSSLAMRNLQIQCAADPLFSMNNGSTGVLLWTGIQMVNTPTLGTISNYQNIVWKDTIISNSANLTLDGTFASFVAETALFDGRSGQTTVIIPATATFLRRFRMLYTAFQVDAGETGINFSASATIPDESYILDNVSFAGAGTYLAGLDYTSNKALFFNNSGIQNSSVLCQYSMTGNATATVIGGTGTFVKIAGTTVPSSLNQKFTTATTQRATYAGSSTANFRAIAFASMTSGNNQTLRMRLAKNGTTIAESNTLFKTTGTGEASAVGCQVIGTLSPGDYVELFVANDTAATNVTVSDLNLTITRL